MSIEPLATDDSITAAVGAALLDAGGRLLNAWSMIFALTATLIMGLQPVGIFAGAGLAASVIAALVQMYFAVRCAFDAAVFSRLGGEFVRYTRFDQLLMGWGLRDETIAVRRVDERVRCAVVLLRRQMYSLCIQMVLFVAGLAAVMWEQV